MTLEATLRVSLRVSQIGANGLGGPEFSPDIEAILALTDGVTANKADRIFAQERTVASGANEDLDLTGLLTDAFGATVSQVELVAIVLINAPKSGAPNTTNLTMGGGSNPVTGFLGGTTPSIGPLRPGATVVLACGDAAGIGAVVAGTGDILRISNSAGAQAKYQIAIIGRSA